MVALIIFLMCMTLVSCTGKINKSEIKNSSIFLEAEVKNILVKSTEANVYSGIKSSLPILMTYPQNSIIEVVGSIDAWYVVLTEEGYLGCINKKDVIPYIEAKDSEINYRLEASLTKLEQRMLDYTNKERERHKLKPLTLDITLTKLARLKTKDLIDNKHFNHYSPNYGSPFEMMNDYNISFIYAGENLAANPTVNGGHKALMESATHRHNILNPNFTHIGIGIQRASTNRLVITQLFIGK